MPYGIYGIAFHPQRRPASVESAARQLSYSGDDNETFSCINFCILVRASFIRNAPTSAESGV
jgi:hypothetical protein